MLSQHPSGGLTYHFPQQMQAVLEWRRIGPPEKRSRRSPLQISEHILWSFVPVYSAITSTLGFENPLHPIAVRSAGNSTSSHVSFSMRDWYSESAAAFHS